VQIEARVDGEEPASELTHHVWGDPRATALHLSSVVLYLEAAPLDERAEVRMHGFNLPKGSGVGFSSTVVQVSSR
jgi:hypothetical protein